MPISKISGILTGELRLFSVYNPKIKLCYKIIYNFHRISPICSIYKQKKHNDNKWL